MVFDVTWRLLTCIHVWHDSFICVWHDSFICVTWLIHFTHLLTFHTSHDISLISSCCHITFHLAVTSHFILLSHLISSCCHISSHLAVTSHLYITHAYHCTVTYHLYNESLSYITSITNHIRFQTSCISSLKCPLASHLLSAHLPLIS